MEYATKVDRGILCLFCYRDVTLTPMVEVGFWMHLMPPLREVRVPERWTGEVREQKSAAIREWLGMEPVGCRNSERGSNDPFGIIDARELSRLPDWRDQVLDRMEAARWSAP